MSAAPLVPLALAAALLAPPADPGPNAPGPNAPGPPADAPADPWAARTGPRMTLENFPPGRITLRPEAPLPVLVRVDPYFPTDVRLLLDRVVTNPPREDGAGGDADGRGEPRRAVESIIGAETQVVRGSDGAGANGGAAGGDAEPGEAPPPGYARLALLPPHGGWPAGRGELRLVLDGSEGATVVRPVTIGRPLLEGFGRMFDPPPAVTVADPPDRGLVLDLNEAAGAAGAGAAGDGPAASVLPGERVLLRGTFRGPAPPAGVAFGPEVYTHFSGAGYRASNGLARSFPEGEPAGDGGVLYWFRQPAYAPAKPGRYRLTTELRIGPPTAPPTPAPDLPPLTITVRPAGDAPDAAAP